MKTNLFGLTVLTVSVLSSRPGMAEETNPGGKAPSSALATLDGIPLPDMQSVSEVKQYIASRKKYDAAVRKASAVIRKKSTPVTDEVFERLSGGMKLDIFQAWLERMQVRAYPGDRVRSEAYLTAYGRQATMPAALIGTASSGFSTGMSVAATTNGTTKTRGGRWEYVGPRSMINRDGFSGTGPLNSYFNGRINYVTFDPRNPNVAYAAAAQGGIWKTVNSGTDWYPLGDSFPVLSSSAIAVSPANSRILLAGLGDHQAGNTFGDIPGIMRSEDGGRSWKQVGDIMAGRAMVSSIEFDPDQPNVAIAATGGGTYRRGAIGGIFYSSDSGLTWKKSIFTPELDTTSGIDIRDMKIGARRPNGSRFYYATNGANVTAIYRSADRGKTWVAISGPFTGTNRGIELAPSAVDPSVIYVADGKNRKVYKGVETTTGGIDWTDITGNIRLGVWGQTFYNFYARAVPQIADGVLTDILYVGTMNINASVGGGPVWKDLTLTYTGKDTIHADQHSLNFNPLNPNQMLVTNDGGIYGARYDSGDRAWRFDSDLNRTMGTVLLYTADWHPTNPQIMIGAAQDNSNPVSLGNTLAWQNVGYGDGMSCGINPTNSKIMYTCSQFEAVFRTADAFKSNLGDDITPPYGNEFRPFVSISTVDPTFPHPYYVATSYLWRWNEPTKSWDSRLGDTELANTAASQSVKCIAIAPSDPNTIYVGTTDARLWVSKDKGATWKKISDAQLSSTGLPNRVVSAISVHPTNPNDILIGLSGTDSVHVYRCSNTSATSVSFTPLMGTGIARLPDVPVNCLERIPGRATTDFFVGTDIGVFYTKDGGTTWQNATAPLGLPNVEVTAMKATPRTGFLNISTYGRGMWRYPITSATRLD